MMYNCSSLRVSWMLLLLSSVLQLLLPQPTLSLVETLREYDLHFNYDAASPIGPAHWKEVDATAHDGWADFDVFQGLENHDLDIVKNECSSRRRPSPVNLYANSKCEDTHEILTRRIRKTDCSFQDMSFEVAPHVLRANMPYSDATCMRPTVDLPNGLPNDWLLTWIEVHLRAEHVIDGRRYDGEVNFIHVGTSGQKRELGAPSMLLDASGTKDEPLMQRFIDRWQAIADDIHANCTTNQRKLQDAKPNDNNKTKKKTNFRSMLEEYRSNLPPMKERFYPRSEYTGEDTEDIEESEDDNDQQQAKNGNHHENRHRRAQITTTTNNNKYDEPRDARRKMFPYNMWPTIHYFRYKGSITYPPCSEIMRWRVFDEPLVISKRQFKQMARLMSSYMDETTCQRATVTSPKGENFRPVREVNSAEQTVTHCTADDFGYWQYPFDKQ